MKLKPNAHPQTVKFGETFKLSSEFKLPSDRTAYTNAVRLKGLGRGSGGIPFVKGVPPVSFLTLPVSPRGKFDKKQVFLTKALTFILRNDIMYP